jgi:hypothetical protein
MTLSFSDWHKLQLAPGNEATPRWALNAETARSIYESMVAPERAKQAEVSEVARLRDRVNQLERAVVEISRHIRTRLKALEREGEAMLKERGIFDNLIDRIEKLEEHAPNSVTLPSSADIAAATRAGPAMHDAGIWTAERFYQAGDLVTHSNGAWIATIESRRLKPGDGAGWRLAHKTEQGYLRRIVREELQKQMKGPRVTWHMSSPTRN